ncbi:flagellar biosynthesis protein FlaG [Marinobacter sp. EhC06]|uniref:flagellar protein FlaG n=1 Tax=Marinobacter TaxID=2742 RepID=UPI0007D9AD93|nr:MULTISPECIES: flagellar protein FlaG [Marinobacter]MCD1648070.1 flagellar protein FlaG [Marinobacter adhaerens]OAN90204.1 flagellar biosynthesis protein FlaG [Marinobacter sp. EhN04]OAN97077.1 flagellar biosynthesis protein FlaG [Marinobacter sp. EhC06]
MNDVNLNSPDLKLVRASDQAPARAISSSQAEGRNASDLASSTAGRVAPTSTAPQTQDVSRTEQLQKQNEAQREELDDAVSQLNSYVQNVQRDLQFEVNNELGQTVVRVVDQQTQEVIRQIPDEVAMRLAENLQQDEPLTLFNIKV